MALTGQTSQQIAPNAGVKQILIRISGADSADTIDLSSSTATGGETLSTIDCLYCYDRDTGDQVTATFSGTTVTIDASGGTTDKDYRLIAWGY